MWCVCVKEQPTKRILFDVVFATSMSVAEDFKKLKMAVHHEPASE